MTAPPPSGRLAAGADPPSIPLFLLPEVPPSLHAPGTIAAAGGRAARGGPSFRTGLRDAR